MKKKYSFIGSNIQNGLNSGFFGHIDAISKYGVEGWLIDLTKPDESLDVNIYLNNTPVASGITYKIREGVSEILGFRVDCGFKVEFDKKQLFNAVKNLNGSELCPLSILLNDEIFDLGQSRILFASEIQEFSGANVIEGHFDAVSNNFVAFGWTRIPSQKKSQLVSILIDGVVVVEQEADFPRPDLISLLPNDDVNIDVGFKIQIPENKFNNLFCKVEAQVNGVTLAGSPIMLDLSSRVLLSILEIKNGKLLVELIGLRIDAYTVIISVDGICVDTLDFNETKNKNVFTSEWVLPKYLVDGQPHVYIATLQDKEVKISSDVAVLKYPNYYFHFDVIDLSNITGWVSRADCLDSFEISFIHNEKILGSTHNNLIREDVIKNQDIVQHFNTGFKFNLPEIDINKKIEIGVLDVENDIIFAEISIINIYEAEMAIPVL